MSNQSNNFNTPIELIEPITKFFGEIDLDPCSNEFSIVNAIRNIKLPMDGLNEYWGINKKVFINPPFAPYYINEGKVITPAEHKELLDKEHWRRYTIKDWVNRIIIERNASNNSSVCLVPSRGTGNSLWQDIIFPNFDSICFLKDRVYYWEEGHPVYDKKGNPQPAEFDCALVLFSNSGLLEERFKEIFDDFGFILRPKFSGVLIE
jgi:hypothetical protein